jgi:hypothetical protein
VWKNISVVDDLPGTAKTTGFLIANFSRRAQNLSLHFRVAKEDHLLFRWGRVLIDVPFELAERLRKGKNSGVKWLSATVFTLTGPDAVIGGRVELRPRELHALNARFVRTGNTVVGARVFNLDVLQYDGDAVVGGVRLALRTHAARVFKGHALDTDHLPGPRDGGTWIGKGPGTGGTCGCC